MKFSAPTNTKRRIVILGSTGSVGTQALEVINQAPDRFEVAALAAGGAKHELLAQQVVRTGARAVAVATGTGEDLETAIAQAACRAGVDNHRPQIFTGPDAVAHVAAWPNADVVLNAVTGSIGLAPTLAALNAGHLLALANKESLIVGGELVKNAAAPGQIVPVDSEHSAIAQALRSGSAEEVDRLVLTASGGPFRGKSRSSLTQVTPEQALAHPTWDMGKMVTTNSATMVNKALEVIEAHLLFDIPLDRIDVVVHPQSVVHSMVQFIDGSTIAQASPPDMKLPIALGIGWPHRVPGAATPCDWTTGSTWTFEPLDQEAFPAVALAKSAAEAAAAKGGAHMAVYNAANEEAVEAFHSGRIGFTDIVDTVQTVLSQYGAESPAADGTSRLTGPPMTLKTVLDAEDWARDAARTRCGIQD